MPINLGAIALGKVKQLEKRVEELEDVGDSSLYRFELDDLNNRLRALEMLLEANYRVIKQDIEAEIREDTQKQMGTELVEEVTETEATATV